MAEIIELNAENFDSTVASGVVLVDFWAPWCNPCKMLGSILEKLAPEAPADAVIGKVNVDSNKALAVKFGVSNIPRMFLYKDGKVIDEFNGVQSKSKILEALNR